MGDPLVRPGLHANSLTHNTSMQPSSSSSTTPTPLPSNATGEINDLQMNFPQSGLNMSMFTSACTLPNEVHTNAIFYPFGLTPSSSTFSSTMPQQMQRSTGAAAFNSQPVSSQSNSFAPLTCPQPQQSTSISNVKPPYPTPIPGMFTYTFFASAHRRHQLAMVVFRR